MSIDIPSWRKWDEQCLKRSEGFKCNLLPTTELTVKVESAMATLAKQYDVSTVTVRNRLNTLRREGFSYKECLDIVNIQLTRGIKNAQRHEKFERPVSSVDRQRIPRNSH